MTQDVVGGGDVEIEIRIGKIEQVLQALEGVVLLAELEREVETLRANAANPETAQNGASGYSMENADLIMSLVQELRNPLTSIYGNIELMMAESFGIIGQMQRQILQKVGSNVKRLTGMIEDLIRVTAMDTGKFTCAPYFAKQLVTHLNG